MAAEDNIKPGPSDDFWDGVLESFTGDPAAAFIMAQTLSVLKDKIESGPEGRLWVIKALDRGIEELYPYSEAHRMGFQIYRLAVEGKLLPKHEPSAILAKLKEKY